MNRSLLFAIWLLLPFAAGADDSMAEGAADARGPKVKAQLLFDVSAVRPGDTFRAGVRLHMAPHWHIYWKNPGEAGLSTDISWNVSGGKAGDLQWPFPSTFRSPDGSITTYGYSEEVLLFSQVTAGPRPGGFQEVSALVNVLACEIECIPAELKLKKSIPTGERTEPDPTNRTAFDAAASQVPTPPSLSSVRAQLVLDAQQLESGKPFGGKLTLASAGGGPLEGRGDFFVPERVAGIERFALLPIDGTAGAFQVTGETGVDLPPSPSRMKGAIRLENAQGEAVLAELDLPLPMFAPSGVAAARGVPQVPRAAAPSAQEFGWMMLLAFLGGALLNLMPCVFPVLALKTYAFARLVSEDKQKPLPHALGYGGGVVASMLALAGAVILLKGLGHSVGWGFQFQQPLFVAAIAAVLVAFALNLFGVFDVGGAGQSMVGKVEAAHGLRRSVGEGVLAVALATPCSAPLLGTAVGFALAAPAWVILAVFTAIGVGLALPFCAMALAPNLAKVLPRPGQWMERMKHLLAFALLGTAVWLLWVMGQLTGADGMARLLAFLLGVAIASWMLGVGQKAAGRNRHAWLAGALSVLVAISAVTLRFEKSAPQMEAAAAAQAFSADAVKGALGQGRPVFVDFTADWCLTCKFNERSVLAHDEVKAAFSQHNAAVFVADWTRGDEHIASLLRAHGRAGVPMYLVYSPARPEMPEVLPELLTVSTVKDALARAMENRPQ